MITLIQNAQQITFIQFLRMIKSKVKREHLQISKEHSEKYTIKIQLNEEVLDVFPKI